MVAWIITLIISHALVFAGGCLVYRKHGAKAEARAKAEVAELEAKIEALKKAAKG